MKKRLLILEDGTVFQGEAFGSDRASQGEVVFTTGMTGYQESITDPSFYGQIVTFTYPLIGNYGINSDDFEAISPVIRGVVVRELTKLPSNFRSETTLDEYLKEHDIPGIEGIDTRKLTRIIRSKGAVRAMLTAAGEEVNVEEIVNQLKETPYLRDHVKHVSTKVPFPSPGRGKRVVLMDFGMKNGILRELNKRDCDVLVVPYNTPAEKILNFHPEGILLSNGPGNPSDVTEAIETLKQLIGKVPMFGICLGHQLLALACGAKSRKLPFGHRGANHPVKNLQTGIVEITSQNHGYVIDENSLEGTDLEITHVSLNDGTIEGLRHKKYPVFSVQFHPEASPGPEDSNYLFDEFIKLMEQAGEVKQHA
ncbi:carbamoyl phosphate synthase small subunit [Ureibacillus terrenus]|uniref:Carbamoyl phosphate synthase small chain n=1 Tax=Ureibacillus terrenus TaxID=118246 RepID=A0A540V488_9BACL|nr:carbamoyl phosphate synthase small subunit [Ureibacillus terrenus]MED3660338.1 carbamoyl phosphate synthase small subunit [Ureibacillus terrenus]MED3762494.1 carbamoyl phosphate synthase small subunit [Ureibacillus terrenus]TQE91561.1 glutamine-hydrolyzing carbamoyl-phosphate synthase small subunit [Ureibacillus terrenus]